MLIDSRPSRLLFTVACIATFNGGVAVASDIEQSIHELFEAETRVAIQNQETQANTQAPTRDSSMRPNAEDELHAIYGVGKQLSAEVTLDAVSMIFQAEHRLPVLGRRTGYELVVIEPPCVKLRRADVIKELCLGIRAP